MGTGPPPKKFDPKSEKQKFEITCIKVRSYLELQRDRRQNSANSKEKALIQMFNSPTRSKQDEIQKASSIITDLNFVKACNIVIRFCDILKENSLRVIEAKGQPAKIENLMPYIESICWSSKPLNLSCIVEFQSQMVYFFGSDLNESIQKTTKVDPDLKDCFKDLLPTPIQINDYMVGFSTRIAFPLSQINAAGHEFAPGGGASYGGPPPNYGGYGGSGGGGQQMQFQISPAPQNYEPPQNYGPPMQFIDPLHNQQQYPAQSFGYQNQVPPQGYMFPPPNNQFGAYQQPDNMPVPQNQQGFNQSAGFGTNPGPQNQGGYPEFGAINVPKNNTALGGGGANGFNQGGQEGNKLPNLDDFEERMKKLRENL